MNKPTVFSLLVFLLVVSLFFNGYLLSRRGQAPDLKSIADKTKVVKNSQETPPAPVQPIELPVSEDSALSGESYADQRQISGLISLNYINSSFDSQDADASGVQGTLTIRLHGLSRHAVLMKENIRFSKPVHLDALVVSEQELSMHGRFSTSGVLEITLPAGIELLNGSKTTSAYSFAVNIPKPAPYIRIPESGPYYPVRATGGKRVSLPMKIHVLNVESIHATLYRSDVRNMDVSNALEEYTYHQRIEKELLIKCAEKSYPVKLRPNCSEEILLDLSEMLESITPGIYHLVLSDHAPEPYEDRLRHAYWHDKSPRAETSIIFSDLAISTTLAEGNGTASVSVLSLTDMKPVAGVAVSLHSLKRQIIATGMTDGAGTALLHFNASYIPEKNPPHTVLVRKGDDVNMLRLTQPINSSDFKNSGHAFRKNHACIYTERGIYRPGEEVAATFVIRQRGENGLKALSLPFNVKVQDPRHTIIYKEQLRTNENGVATMRLHLPPLADNGSYNITCGVGNEEWGIHSFRVGAFVPDRIKVTLKPKNEILLFNQKNVFEFDANYYFGLPVEDATVRATLYAKTTKAPHWKDYAVGMASDYKGTLLKDTSKQSIQKMRPCIVFQEAENLFHKEKMARLPQSAEAVVEVTEQGGNTVTAQASNILLPSEYYVGLKQLPSANGVAQFEIRLLTWDKATESSLPQSESVNLRLIKHEWQYISIIENDRQRYEWQRVEVMNTTLPNATLTNGIVKLPIAAIREGLYDLQATCNGLTSSLEFYFEHGEAGSVRSANPNILEVSSDKEIYRPGDTARISFQAKRPGSCIAVIGEMGILQTQTCQVQPGKNTLEIKIPGHITSGNLFVHLTMANQYKENYARSFAFVKLPLDQNAHRLDLSVECTEKAEPGARIPVTIRTKNMGGAPLPATVQLLLVDEGILSLTSFKTPDVFAFFHGDYRCNFVTHDFFNSIYSRIADRAKSGGDGGLQAMRRIQLKTEQNAILLPPLADVGEEGVYRTELTLPKHTGALRVMAVGVGKEHLGSFSTTITLRDKLSVLPSAPVAVAEKDTFQVSFRLFNHDLDAKDACFTFKAEGFERKTAEIQRIEIPKGTTTVVTHTLQARANGSFTLPYTLELGGKSVTGNCIINVRAIQPFVTRMRLDEVAPGESMELQADSKEWQSLSLSNVLLSPSPALAVPDALEWLRQYPYGCLEQTTSCAFPFLYVDRLIQAGILPPGAAADANDRLNAAYIKLIGMIRSHRGFTSWPDTENIWFDASLYAAHFLMKAKPAVFTGESLKNVRSFLDQTFQKSTQVTEAYALYLLALGDNSPAEGKRIRSNALNLLQGKTKPSPLAQFLLGAALYRSGYAQDALPYLTNALDAQAWEENVSQPWILDSRITRTGMVLAIASELTPSHPACAKMALQLNTMLKKSSVWGSTRGNAWAIIGLSAYAAKHPQGKALAEITINGRTEKIDGLEKEKTYKLLGKGSTKLTNTGSGSFYVKRIAAGIPTVLQQEANPVIQVKKEYLDANGKPVTQVAHGDRVTVRITFESKVETNNLVLLDLIPGGFQIEDASLATRAGNPLAQECVKGYFRPYIERQESLQDRFLLFGGISEGEKYAIAYTLRATTPGTFAIPPIRLEDMYDGDVCGTHVLNGTITVK